MWSIDVDEISPYVFRVVALARDGRKIEATGTNEEQLRKDLAASIKDSDEQIERLRERRTGNGKNECGDSSLRSE